MEAGEAGELSSYAAVKVEAANHLSREGWWRLTEAERTALNPLLRAGLQVGVNLNLARLGLRPYVVSAETDGNQSLWDVSNGDCHAFRSYRSSTLGALMLATPPKDFDYAEFWGPMERKGLIRELKLIPMDGVRFLMAPVQSFDDQLQSFDFSWDELGRRPYHERDQGSDYVLFGREVSSVLNRLIENPATASLSELASAAGVDRRTCEEAIAYVSEYPMCVGFSGFDLGRQSGLLLCYEGLEEEEYWKVRAMVRDIPFTTLEAWGRDGPGYNYFAEMVVPPQRLAETTDYLGSKPIRSGRIAYGFHDPRHFFQHALLTKPKRE